MIFTLVNILQTRLKHVGLHRLSKWWYFLGVCNMFLNICINNIYLSRDFSYLRFSMINKYMKIDDDKSFSKLRNLLILRGKLLRWKFRNFPRRKLVWKSPSRKLHINGFFYFVLFLVEAASLSIQFALEYTLYMSIYIHGW